MKISIQVKPNARDRQVAETGRQQYLVKVKAPAREDKANLEAIEALAEYFHVPKSRISILTGHRSKRKVVQVEEG